MNLGRIRWLTIVAPAAFLVAVQFLAALFLIPNLPPHLAYLLLLAVMLAGVIIFSTVVFRLLETMEGRVIQRNLQLEALQEMGVSVTSELALDAVLQKVVDLSCGLVDARYGALGVVDAEGHIERFITSGLTSEEVERIGSPPRGEGILGVVIHEQKALRLAHLGKDPRSVGFPPNHPPMTS